ncbi:unnamed protein product, partial [marine sediment metagenome]
MKVSAVKTNIVNPHDSILKLISDSIEKIPEKSILGVTSKIISICQEI